MTDEEFEKLVAAGIDVLPERVRTKMRNVAIVIAEEPMGQQKKTNDLSMSETLFGLYEGVPQTERDSGYCALPDKISIFRNPILASYSDPEEIKICVANTVWHEVAHHFGMDEAEVEAEEMKRGKLL